MYLRAQYFIFCGKSNNKRKYQLHVNPRRSPGHVTLLLTASVNGRQRSLKTTFPLWPHVTLLPGHVTPLFPFPLRPPEVAKNHFSQNSSLTSHDPSTWSRDSLFFSPARGRCSRSYKRWRRPLRGQLLSAYVCEYIRPIEINLWNLRSPCHYK
jgi:hypothetical protein